MSWTEIRANWQGVMDPVAEKQAASPPSRVAKLRRKIWRRDLLESVIAVLLAPVFGVFSWFALTRGKWVIFAFSFFLTAAVLYVPWRLWRERRKLPKPDPQRPVKIYLLAERDAMRAQAELLESIWWWYLGPLGFGVIGLYVSMRGLVWQSLAYSTVVALMYLAIGWSNKKAARTQFRVAIEEIDEQLTQLENGREHADAPHGNDGSGNALLGDES